MRYINPKNCTKEEFCFKNGVQIVRPSSSDYKLWDEDLELVCLVQNHGFSAACICETYDDFLAMKDPNDIRPKSFFLISEEDLRNFK